MAIFDQRGQQVTYQYNAAGDINFGAVQNRMDLVGELGKLQREMTQAKQAGVFDEGGGHRCGIPGDQSRAGGQEVRARQTDASRAPRQCENSGGRGHSGRGFGQRAHESGRVGATVLLAAAGNQCDF